jgi:hypothetical protein
MENLIHSEPLKDYDNKINEQRINFHVITKEISKAYII